MNQSQTIAILRRPDELVALVSIRRFQITAPRYGDSLTVDPYEERIVPLDEVTDLNRDRLRELQKRWKRLATVTLLNKAVTADIKEVLGSTIPEEVQPTVDPWRPPVEPKRPRATAAHPRAYRGTKAQPPSPSKVPVVDLRPHLCNLRDLREILEFIESGEIYPSNSSRFDFYADSFQDVAALACPLRYCLWMVGVGNVKDANLDLAEIIGHYWALELEHNDPLRRAVARLLSEPWHTERLEWLHIVRHIAPHRREATLISLLENVNCSYPEPTELSRWLLRMSELSDDESFFNRVWAFAQAIQRGASIDALLSGFEMANRYQPDHDFVNKPFDDRDATRGTAEWIEYVRTATDPTWNREAVAMHIWDACGQLAGLANLFDKRNWQGLSPEDAFDLFDVFRDCRYAETPEAMEFSFAVLLRVANRYFDTIRSLPEDYRGKGIRMLRCVTMYWEGKRLEQALNRMLDLIPVVCAEPFDKSCESQLYSSMLNLTQPDYATWRSGKLESLLALDRASRNHNEAALIAIGLARLAKDYSSWLVEAFEHAVGPLLNCAHTFGCLAKTQHFEAMEAALLHPISCCRETELHTLASHIVEHLPTGVHDPVPSKVKAMVRGEVTLTEGQMQRAVAKIQSELARTKIELARHSAVAVLANALGVPVELAETKAVQHAVKLQNMAMENRRALRKFLRAYLSGSEDYLNKHPANQRWLKQHPEIDFDKWRNGITHSFTDVEGAMLTLSVELNPLEALQLGSYVGSCLGIGGMLVASAAAVVLDINKSVIYARNQRGKVVARQLVAIAENSQLVAFSVYPDSVSSSLKQAFADFDCAFADHLNVSLYLPDHDEEQHEVARPISSYWWDDLAWGLT